MLDTLRADEILAEAKVPKAQREAHIVLLREIMTDKLATKEDLGRVETALKQDIGRVEKSLEEKIEYVETGLKENLRSTERRLEEKIGHLQEKMIERSEATFQRTLVHMYAVAFLMLTVLLGAMKYL